MPKLSKKGKKAQYMKRYRAKQKALKDEQAAMDRCKSSDAYHYVMGYVFNQFEDQYRENYKKVLPNPFYDSLLSADEEDDEVYVIRHYYEDIEACHQLPENVDEDYVFCLLYPDILECVSLLEEVSEIVFKSKSALDDKIKAYEDRFKLKTAEHRINYRAITTMEEHELLERTRKVDNLIGKRNK